MALETETPFPATNPFASRVLSAFQLLVGAFIVIGHNVFHIVPNEVIVLFVLGLASIRLRDGRLSSMGFERPASWRLACESSLGNSSSNRLLDFSGRRRPRQNWRMRLPEMQKWRFLRCCLCGRLPHLVRRSHIGGICLHAQSTSGKDRQQLTGLES